MPKQPWELEGWEKRRDATWPLGWIQGGRKFRLVTSSEPGCLLDGMTWEVQEAEGALWHPHHTATDHEAASLIREHWRVWLAKEHRGKTEFSWVRPRRVVQHREMFYVQAFFQGKGWRSGELGEDEFYTTYDTAQAAGIDAVLAEKETT